MARMGGKEEISGLFACNATLRSISMRIFSCSPRRRDRAPPREPAEPTGGENISSNAHF